MHVIINSPRWIFWTILIIVISPAYKIPSPTPLSGIWPRQFRLSPWYRGRGWKFRGFWWWPDPAVFAPQRGSCPDFAPAERGSNSRATWLPRLHFREMKTGGMRDKRRVARANKPLGRARIQIKLESDMTRSSGASMILSPSRGGRLSWKTIGNLWERAFRNDFSKLNWEMVLEMVLD